MATAPSGSCATKFRTEMIATFLSLSVNCGLRESRSTGHRCRRISHNWYRCPAIRSHARSIGSIPRRLQIGQKRPPKPTAAPHDPPVPPQPIGCRQDGQAEVEAEELQRIWRECFRLPSISLTDNFFEIGGDSLIAVGVAMSATNPGTRPDTAGPL